MTMSHPGGGVNKRREARIPANLDAVLLSYRRRDAVRIIDLSSNGAMVTGEDIPERGDEVVLTREGHEVVATVAWKIEPNCGLSFHRMIEVRDWLKAAH